MEAESKDSIIEYQYKALNDGKSVRLMYLHTSSSYHQLPIEVSLCEFPIDACPSFGALSYAWSIDDEPMPSLGELLCDGASIKITINCEAALKRLRQPNQDQILWVDAVCINQADVEERSLQVRLMRQIYTQASWVALWVGDTSTAIDEESGLPLSDLGMDYLHDFAVEIAERTNSGQNLNEGPLHQEFIKDRRAFQYSESKVFTPRVRGLWDVFHRNWWKRLWVIQELALAKQPTLLCGLKAEAFHNFKIVIHALIRSQQPVEVLEFNSLFIACTFHQFHVRHMVESGYMGKILPPGVKALDILNATRNAHATDPRDKIYGILGFFGPPATDPENIFPDPDYKTPAAELYADVSRAIIVNTKKLYVMSSCYGFFKSTVPDLPSWAASWNDTPVQYFDGQIFNAAGSSNAVYEDSDDKLLLRIKGRQVDSVKLSGRIPDSIGYSNEACIELWRYWWKFASALDSYPTGEAVADVFKDTLCWGCNLDYTRHQLGEDKESFNAWLEILTGTDDTGTAAENIFNNGVPFKYAHRATSVTWGRNMSITDKGYLAMVPIVANAEDKIVIFQGSKLPFIVRTGEGVSMLGGPCYVRGMMDGEFATEGDAQAIDDLEWFTLK